MSAEAAQLANEAAKEGVLGTLGVNWKLLIAQLINFSVVLLVMWKWVYTPLLKLIEDRQKKVEQGIRDAEASARSRSESERQAETAILAARKEAQRLLEEATTAGDRLRAEMAGQANEQVARIVEEGRRKLAEEKEKAVKDAKNEIAGLVVAATEKVLAETTTDQQHRELIEASARRIIS